MKLRESLPEIVAATTTGLLVIDMQRDLCFPDYKPTLERTADLIAESRRMGVFRAYVQNTVLPNGLSDSPSETARRATLGLPPNVTLEGTVGHEFVDEVTPHPADLILQKHRLSAFAGTSLEPHLRARAIETVMIAGVATHGCVASSAYAAQANNYYVVVVEDCVMSWDKDLHDATIAILQNTMNVVTTSSDIIAAWRFTQQTRKDERGDNTRPTDAPAH